VRLRAVPSPSQPESTTPRIRLPQHAAPQPMSATSGVVQPPSYYVLATPPNLAGGAQQVQISPLAPSPQVALASLVATSGSVTSPDGFRRRGSIR
jgi:hypothetical protein